MYLCLCYGVTDKKIKEMMLNGKCEFYEIQKESRAGTSCGSCVLAIDAFIKKNQSTESKEETMVSQGAAK